MIDIKAIEERLNNTKKAHKGEELPPEIYAIEYLLDEVKRLKKYEEGIGAPIRRLLDQNERLTAELEEYKSVVADLAGTNSCVNDGRKAKLFLKHRLSAQELQHKYIGVKGE